MKQPNRITRRAAVSGDEPGVGSKSPPGGAAVLRPESARVVRAELKQDLSKNVFQQRDSKTDTSARNVPGQFL